MHSSGSSSQVVVVRAQPERWEEEAGQWSTGLCDCWQDIGDCGFALCCLPVFTCKVTSAVGACPCLPLLDCVGCGAPASLAMRASVRERYGIKGGVWSDCFYGCCCYPLSWLQISRELKRRAAARANSQPPSSSSSPSSCYSSTRYSALSSLHGVHLV
ncbi:placenta-specific gene 8 protein-like [Aplochiton taeniatus]